MDPASVMRALVELIPRARENLQGDLQLAADAREEFEELTEVMEEIGDFIKNAYSKEVIDKELKRGIKRMRNFLYDSEDAIEDLRRRKSNCTWKGLASYLSHHYGDRNFTVESRGIKETLQKYKDNLGRTAPLEAHYGLSGTHAQSSSAGHGSSSDVFVEKTDALVGIKEPMNQLVGLLTENPPTSKVIFVHGVQGVGKTSLVGAVLRHERVRLRFKYCVWIEDIRSCELASNTATALMEANVTTWNLTMGEVNNEGSAVELRTAFGQMKEKATDLTANNLSWALVLDDAGRADVFRLLLSHLIETRPSVLVTTRVRSLACSSMHHLKKSQYVLLNCEHVLLSESDSRTLFCRKMDDTYEDLLLECEKSRTLKDAFGRILRRCKGLPLAILATCRLLKNNNQFGVAAVPDAVQWTDWSGRLEEELLSKGHVVDPNGRKIILRIDHLLDVRDCLYYLSIFPLDRPIRCSTMMRLWMAVGLIKQKGSQPVQEKAEGTLEKLLEHNVIREKRTSYGRVKTVRVHNLLHQIIISESNDEELMTIVAGRVERLPESLRHLSFHSPMDQIDHGTSVKRLRSLHVFKKVHPPSLKKLLENAERLKVLHIQRHFSKEVKQNPLAYLETFPRNILRSKYLRYLSLRDTDVKTIPEDIKDLAYLESLDLRGTLVDELPEGILKLTALCHLLVSRSSRNRVTDTDLKLGVKAPSKLGDLALLQKLCMIDLEPVKRAKQWKREQLLEELGKLTYLRKLGLSMLESTDAELLCSSIEKLTNLVALRLIAAPGQKIDLSKKDMGQALKRLQRLHLTGCLGTLPKWILCSEILVKLVLKRSQFTVDTLQQLGKLLNLKHLELEQAFDVTDMRFQAEKFQELRFLGLDRFDKLETIRVDEGALPTLERLSLARCNSLKDVPSFITHRTKLKCLELCGMPQEFDKAVEVIIKEVRQRMKVKSKKWIDPVVEEVIILPQRSGWSRWVPLPFKK